MVRNGRRRLGALVGATLLVLVAVPGWSPPAAGDPVVGPEVTVAPDGAGAQTDLEAATDGTNRLVVWEDARTGSLDVYAARVAPDGTRLDPAGIPVATGPGDQRAPSVGFDGTRFLVAWTSSAGNGDVRAARVSTAGVVLDPAGITIAATSAADRAEAVARSGDGFLVTWLNQVTSTGSGQLGAVRATRISTSGTVLDPFGILVSDGTSPTWNSASAWDGSTTLVVWGAFLSSGHGRPLHAARVSPEGQVLDQPALLLANYPGVVFLAPDVAWTGSAWLAVTHYNENTCGTCGTGVEGFLIASDGTVLASDIDVGAGGSPSVACTATCLVAWQRDGDVRGRRFAEDGAPLDDQSFPVAASTVSEGLPEAVVGPGGGWSVAYDRPVAEAPANGAARAFLRTVAPK